MLILILAPLFAFVAIAVGASPGVLTFVILKRLQNRNQRRVITVVSGVIFVLCPIVGVALWSTILGMSLSAETFLVLPLLAGFVLGWLSGLLRSTFHSRTVSKKAGFAGAQSSNQFWSRNA